MHPGINLLNRVVYIDRKMKGYEILLHELRNRKGEWTVSDLMSTAVKTIDRNGTMKEAIDKMREHGVHCLVVTEEDQPVGVVSTYDALLVILKKHYTDDVNVSDVMSTELLTASPEEDAFEVLERIMDHHVNRLIVFDDGHLQGVISATDLIDAFNKGSGYNMPAALAKSEEQIIVKDVMNTPITIDKEETVSRAVKKMGEENIGSLLVTDSNNRVTGIITERDILKKTMGMDLDHKQVKVKEIMTEELYTIDANEHINEASRYFNKHHFRRLPVMEGDEIVGIISSRDVAKIMHLKRGHGRWI